MIAERSSSTAPRSSWLRPALCAKSIRRRPISTAKPSGLALTARQQQLTLSDALASAEADAPDAPDAFLTELDVMADWLRLHLVVVADPKGKRPAVPVPEKFKTNLDEAWEAAL